MAVYIVQTRESKRVKIGFTKNGQANRVSSLNTGCPEHLDLLYFISKATHECERLLHKVHKDQRIKGEWFRPEGSIIEMFNALGELGSVGLADFIEKHRCMHGVVDFGTHTILNKLRSEPEDCLGENHHKKRISLVWVCPDGTRRPAAWDDRGNVMPGVVVYKDGTRKRFGYGQGQYAVQFFIGNERHLKILGLDPEEAQLDFEDFIRNTGPMQRAA